MLVPNSATELGSLLGTEDGSLLGIELGTALGEGVGPDVGAELGKELGAALGAKDGCELGDELGTALGDEVGPDVGAELGELDGSLLGEPDGSLLGVSLGAALGDGVGPDVGAVLGTRLGAVLGSPLGWELGAMLGAEARRRRRRQTDAWCCAWCWTLTGNCTWHVSRPRTRRCVGCIMTDTKMRNGNWTWQVNINPCYKSDILDFNVLVRANVTGFNNKHVRGIITRRSVSPILLQQHLADQVQQPHPLVSQNQRKSLPRFRWLSIERYLLSAAQSTHFHSRQQVREYRTCYRRRDEKCQTIEDSHWACTRRCRLQIRSRTC